MSDRPTLPTISSDKSSAAPAVATRRLMSIDALRGFDMFWIIGADALMYALEQVVKKAHTPGAGGAFLALIGFLTAQMDHCEWIGFHFYDLIFPLFVFIVGVSLVFSLSKALEQAGRAEAMKRIFRRAVLLFFLGIFHWGGVTLPWPDIRIMGVLQRIAVCYLFTGLIFAYCDLRKMVAICGGLLVGYWALMTWMPIRDIQLTDENLAPIMAQTGIKDPKVLFQSTTNWVTGHFERGHNVSDHFDFQHLPGEKYDTYFDPEGFLSTFPAIATCLLGVFAGLLLQNGRIMDQKKVIYLIAAGFIAINIGWVWGLQFPVIKKIWTSSFVLVAGGCSAILLGGFYLVIDIWKYQKWCQPFVWMGMNAITIYLGAEIIGFDKMAKRFVGGDVAVFLDRHLLPGCGNLLVQIVALFLAFCLVRFLYRKKIFLRV